MYNLSVLLPGIRPGNWSYLYNSIEKSYSGSFELVIASPYELPISIRNKSNITLIKTYRSPTASQQLALIEATGEYITYAADDGYFLPNSLDIAIKSLEGQENTVVCGKYNEGAPNPDMMEIEYYKIYTHDGSRCEFLPKDCLMLMVGVVPRYMLIEIGGLDCRFEALPMAFNDWSIRLYNKGVKFIFQKEQMFSCTHLPGELGDHAPIHKAQTFKDTPLFKIIYSSPKSKERIKIDLDNWKNTPEVWKERFNEKLFKD